MGKDSSQVRCREREKITVGERDINSVCERERESRRKRERVRERERSEKMKYREIKRDWQDIIMNTTREKKVKEKK